MLKGDSFIVTLTLLLALLATKALSLASSQETDAQQVGFGTTEESTEAVFRLINTIVRLTGWHARALKNPYPSSFDWTVGKNQFDFSASRGSEMIVAFLRDKYNRGVVIDSMGRILLPVEEDYTRMVELARYTVRKEFYNGAFEEEDDLGGSVLSSVVPPASGVPRWTERKMYHWWTVNLDGATCKADYYWSIRVPDAAPGEEEWKDHYVKGFDPREDSPPKLKRSVNGYDEIPSVLYHFMILTYEGVELEVVEKDYAAMTAAWGLWGYYHKAFRAQYGYYNW